MQYHTHIPPRRVLFSGGGIKILAHVGAIMALHDHHMLSNVREWAGVSAGGFMALLLCLHYTPQEIYTLCTKFDFSNVRHIEAESLLDVLDTYGLDNGHNLEILLESVLKYKKFPANATFEDLQKAGYDHLTIWASDVHTHQSVTFSTTATPHISVLFAARASMSYPLYFTPVIHPRTKHYLVDGGLLGNYPIYMYEDYDLHHTLGIMFTSTSISLPHANAPPINDFTAYLTQLLSAFHVPRTRAAIEKYADHTIVIPLGSFSALQFEITEKEKQQLIQAGRDAVEQFLKRKPYIPFRRRHSVS
jgi:NTE family protein